MSSPPPTHPSAIKVIRQPGSFASYSISTTTLPPGSLLARLASPPLTLTTTKRYSSVQVSATSHIELNCDFLYVNHSCNPSVEFHVISPNVDDDAQPQQPQQPILEIRVASRRDGQGNEVGIKPGDELTFFYPSTEWDMDQPFQCQCRSARCLGTISGAKDLSEGQLDGYFVNAHIRDLRRRQ
jgi:hypothetical protein